MKVIPYKQTTSLSCLPSCLLMCFKAQTGAEFDKIDEQNLLFKGLLFTPDIYHIGIINEFVKKYKQSVRVWVDSKYFSKILTGLPISPRLKIEFGKINSFFIRQILEKGKPFIIYLDMFYLRNSIHSPHFVVVEGKRKERMVIVDPWKWCRFLMKKNQLDDSIDSLRKYLNFCPILIEFEK